MTDQMTQAMSFTDHIHWVTAIIPVPNDHPKMLTLCNQSGMMQWDLATEDEIKKGPRCRLCNRMKEMPSRQ